jgi:DNA-binding LacI/PurR family transcriptional regulator
LDVLGYERPTKLRGERGRLVGLVLPELQNPIFPAFAEIVSGSLAQQGFTPLLCTQTAGGVSEADYIELLLSHRVSGVVFAGGLYAQADAPHEHYQLLAKRRLPTVMVNAAIDGLPFPRVSCDDTVAAEQAFSHLRSLGHTRIGLLMGPSDHVPSQRKIAAALACAAQAGTPINPDVIVHSLYSLEAAQAAAVRLLARGVTGIVCASDPMALGAIRAVRRTGRSVPRDVSVVGFDDSALMTSIDPPLTTVRQPIEPMGRMVIDLLIGQMGRGVIGSEEYLFEPELVVRGSTGPVPVAESSTV